MKTRLLIIIGIIGLSVLITPQAFGVPFASLDNAFDNAHRVVLGEITSAHIIDEPIIVKGENTYSETPGFAIYNVEFLQHFKGDTNTIEGVVGSDFLYEPHGMSYQTTPFNQGDIVKFYLIESKENKDAIFLSNPAATRLYISAEVNENPMICADKFNEMYEEVKDRPCSCCNPEPGGVVCEPIGIDSQIRDLVKSDFNSCINSLENWAYLTDSNDYVWYTFGESNFNLEIDKVNNEKEIPVKITFSDYDGCTDVYLTINTHDEDRELVYLDGVENICDNSATIFWYQNNEIDLASYLEPIILEKKPYVARIYTEDPRPYLNEHNDFEIQDISKVYFSSFYEPFSISSNEVVEICGPGTELVDGICKPLPTTRVVIHGDGASPLPFVGGLVLVFGIIGLVVYLIKRREDN